MQKMNEYGREWSIIVMIVRTGKSKLYPDSEKLLHIHDSDQGYVDLCLSKCVNELTITCIQTDY